MMNDIRLALMCGIDIPIPECQLTAHQPSIKEISYIGEKDFFIGAQTICIDKNIAAQDKDILVNTTNFQIFMTIMSDKETASKKEIVQDFLTLLFPQYKTSFTPRSLIFSKKGEMELITIDEENFDALQNTITEICCLRSNIGGQTNFNPADARAREIAEKMMRARARVAAQKGEDNSSIFSQYISTLTIGLNSMSLQDLQNLTIFQLFDLMERYNLYLNWDIDIRSRLAGGKPDNKPDNWMKNIH